MNFGFQIFDYMSVSIIVPTLNRPHKLLKLIRKLSHLIDQDEEVIIVDDSSQSQVQKIKKQFSDNVVYVNRGNKLGVSSARNLGTKMAKGQYLVFLDDDDDFTLNWLTDFRNSLVENPDLVFCNMIRVDPSGQRTEVKISDSRNGAMGDRIVIPGAWLIKKTLFDKIGSYDERILFAENTELFFRVFKEHPSVSYIDQFNFIYHPCPTGGSKNLRNMIDSLIIILDKHAETLSPHVKHLYHQIIGVNWMRFRNFSNARKHLWKAVQYKPQRVATWGRLGLAFFPILAKKLYSETVNHG